MLKPTGIELTTLWLSGRRFSARTTLQLCTVILARIDSDYCHDTTSHCLCSFRGSNNKKKYYVQCRWRLRFPSVLKEIKQIKWLWWPWLSISQSSSLKSRWSTNLMKFIWRRSTAFDILRYQMLGCGIVATKYEIDVEWKQREVFSSLKKRKRKKMCVYFSLGTVICLCVHVRPCVRTPLCNKEIG